MSKLFLVYGGESTGTRLMTKILIEGAGLFGDSGHEQRLDDIVNHLGGQGLGDILRGYGGIVWRRSFPHNRAWLHIEREYDVVKSYFGQTDRRVVVMTRNWLAAARSQVAAKHVDNIGLALTNLQEAYKYILRFLERTNLRYHMVSFDLLVRQAYIYLPYLFEELGLPQKREDLTDVMINIHESNEKHLWEVLHEQEKRKRAKNKS